MRPVPYSPTGASARLALVVAPLVAFIACLPGAAAHASTYHVLVGTIDRFGVGHGGTSGPSTLPVGLSDSQDWDGFRVSVESEAAAAAGTLATTPFGFTPYPLLSSRSFVHMQNQPPRSLSGGIAEVHSSASFVYETLLISGPPGVVAFSVNFEIEGGIRADRQGFNMGAAAGVSVSGGIRSDQGLTEFVLGDIGTCERGAGALGFGCTPDGANHFSGTGAFAGLSSGGRFGVVAASPVWRATVGTPVAIELFLSTGANALEFQDGDGSNFSTAVSDFANTAGLWDGGPLFNLPEGYTVNSSDGLVVNNRLRPLVSAGDGGGPGPGPGSSVPAAPALWLVCAGVAALAFGVRRRQGLGVRVVGSGLVIIGVTIAHVGESAAAPVTFGFGGRVTSTSFGPDDQPYPNEITILTTFTGGYTFDSSAPDADPASSVGGYAMAGAPFGLSIDIGGNAFATANRLLVEVDDAPSLDAYVLVAGNLALFRLEVGLTLQDPTGTALPGDGLPLTPPALAAFAIRTLDFRNDVLDRGLVHITGRIDSLSCLAGCAAAGGGSPLPAPPTLLLLSAPLALAGLSLPNVRARA